MKGSNRNFEGTREINYKYKQSNLHEFEIERFTCTNLQKPVETRIKLVNLYNLISFDEISGIYLSPHSNLFDDHSECL